MIPKHKIGDKIGCVICVPTGTKLEAKNQAVIISINIPTEEQARLGRGISYMVRYPSGFVDWLNESVTRV